MVDKSDWGLRLMSVRIGNGAQEVDIEGGGCSWLLSEFEENNLDMGFALLNPQGKECISNHASNQ